MSFKFCVTEGQNERVDTLMDSVSICYICWKFPTYSNTTAAQCILLYYQIRKKVAFCTPWRHKGEWRNDSTHSWPRQ